MQQELCGAKVLRVVSYKEVTADSNPVPKAPASIRGLATY